MALKTATTTNLRSLFMRLSFSPSALVHTIPPARQCICRTITTTTTTTTTHTTIPRPHTPFPRHNDRHAAPGFRAVHTTAARGGPGGRQQHQQAKRGKSKKKGAAEPDARIVNLKSSMSRRVPAPLRFARNRHLRHWTIHRAWLLFQRKERERRDIELNRMYQSIHAACEELRKTSGPGTRDEGFLFRVAQEKMGVFGHRGIPIEYARPQTETPAREPWNHGWTRQL